MKTIAILSIFSYLIIMFEAFDIQTTREHVIFFDLMTVILIFTWFYNFKGKMFFLPKNIKIVSLAILIYLCMLVASFGLGCFFSGNDDEYFTLLSLLLSQTWPVLQILVFFVSGALLQKQELYFEFFFIIIISLIAIVDISTNINYIEILNLSRPLVVQSTLFIFNFLLLLERIVGNTKYFGWKNLIMCALLCINFIAILMTVTRTSLLAVAIGSCVMLYQLNREKGSNLKAFLIFQILFIGLFALLWYAGFVEPFENRGVVSYSDDTREMIWADALRIFKEHPFIGVGPGFYVKDSEVFVDVARYGEIANIQISSAHNNYLNVLATTGLVGFLFFSNLLIKLYLVISKELSGVDWLKTFFYVSFVLSLFSESVLLPSTRYAPVILFPFWFFLGKRISNAAVGKNAVIIKK